MVMAHGVFQVLVKSRWDGSFSLARVVEYILYEYPFLLPSFNVSLLLYIICGVELDLWSRHRLELDQGYLGTQTTHVH